MAESFVFTPGVVFPDHLTVTVPKDFFSLLLPELEAVLDRVLCESPVAGVYLCPSGGWVKTGERSGVCWVQTSGAVLAALRRAGAYPDFLSVFSVHPHRVTRLDAALDVEVEPNAVLFDLYARGRAGQISLTRKHVKPRSVVARLSPAFYDLAQDTGTVSLGSRTAEVRLIVYDKRQEHHTKTGEDIGHMLVRYELRVTDKMGASLKDAHSPASVFWHFVSPDVLPLPQGVEPWVTLEDLGFALDRRTVEPYQRLKNRVQSSQELARLFALADQCGPEGRRLLYGLVRRFHDSGSSWGDVQRAVLTDSLQPEF